MRSSLGFKAMLGSRAAPREKIAAALRCLILVTVFAMAWVQSAARSPGFDLVIGFGAAYVLITTFLPWSRMDRRRATLMMLSADIGLITALLYTQAGTSSEYYLLYYLPILHASVRLNFRDAVATCVLSAASYMLVGLLEGTETEITTTVISRVLTFTLSAALLAAFFVLLAREHTAHERLKYNYQDAMQAKSDFLSRVSHEFRTPLTAIVGFTQLLYEHEDQLDADRQHDYLVIIRDQAQHLARMIEDMLDLVRIDEGRLVLRRGSISLQEAVESGKMLLEDPAARERVTVAAEPRTPAAYADRNEIEQVTSRLLLAALGQSEDGAEVSVRIGPAADEEQVQMMIQASGMRADDDILAPLFGPAMNSTSQKLSSGQALGLTVSRALIELHGGRIWVDEGSDGEATICFSVPDFRAEATGPEVIVGTSSQESAKAGAEANDEADDSGRRPVGAEAHA